MKTLFRSSCAAVPAPCSLAAGAAASPLHRDQTAAAGREARRQDRGARSSSGTAASTATTSSRRVEDVAEEAAARTCSSAACRRCSTSAGRIDAAIFYHLRGDGPARQAAPAVLRRDPPRPPAHRRARTRSREWLQKQGVDPEKFDRDREVLRRAEQDAPRAPADRRLQDRRHAGDGGARPLHGQRRPGPHAARHASRRSTSLVAQAQQAEIADAGRHRPAPPPASASAAAALRVAATRILLA